MIRSYFIIAWRNILKYRFYSLVNIIGLMTGITFTMLIGAYVWGELQVNKKLRNADRQFFLKSNWKDPNQGIEIVTFGPLAKRLKHDYPSLVANYYRWDGITSNVSTGTKVFREGLQLGDSSFFSMFGFELLHGDTRTALNDPTSLVITKDAAIKYFGKDDVIGQRLTIESFSGTKQDFQITGVLKEFPENTVTHINAPNDNKFFIPVSSMAFFGRQDIEAWTTAYIPSYIELQPGVKPEALTEPIKKLLRENIPPDISANVTVQPISLAEYYLTADKGLVERMLYTLSFVAGFILLMAVVNFVNISVSRSSSRMKEIGIRKVLGGLRQQLIFQFLTESFILVLIATLLAVGMYSLVKPYFSSMIGKEIPWLGAFPIYFLLLPFGLALTIGIMAGLYPAIVLSSLKSVDSLKGKLKTIQENVFLRKSLVGFQFCIAIVVFIAAIIVSQQINYFFKGNLGYNKDYIVTALVPRDWSPKGVSKIETIRNEFARMPEVAQATISYEIPDGMNGGQGPVYKNGTDSTRAIAMQSMISDEFYADTYQIPIKAGAFFTNSHGLDSTKVVLNETAVKALGWANPQEAVGQLLWIPGSPTVFNIEGVIADYHFASLQEKIAPFIYFHIKSAVVYRCITLKIKPGNIPNTISTLEKKWYALLPGTAFEFKFIDDSLKKVYATELQLKKASYTATTLAFIIVFLGVFGLISLSLHKRIKEIGIRKVLGAGLPDIIILFVKEFIIIILVAGIIATPLAWMAMHNWLANYAYRIDITPWPFIWASVTLGIITLLLIGFQSLKAALANPVKSLRTE